MSEYPDPDEEFELMYADDLEALKDNEDENPYNEPENTARRSLDFSSPAIRKTFGQATKTIPAKTKNIFSNKTSENSQTDLIEIDDIINNEELLNIIGNETSYTANENINISGFDHLPGTLPGSQKRTVEDLFGDINDIEFDLDSMHLPKKRKSSFVGDPELAMIDQILESRRRKLQQNHPGSMLGKDYTDRDSNKTTDNLASSMPKWPFITLTRSDGEKVYVRFHNEDYMDKEIDEIGSSNLDFKNLLGNAFKDTWAEAKTYLENKSNTIAQVQTEDNLLMDLESLEQNVNNSTTTQLWVDRYKPMRYIELLSDESTNRTLLHWLKMWDKIVFNREVKIKKPEVSSKFNKRSGKFEFGANRKFPAKGGPMALSQELDEHGRPEHKVALLCGPPGCGKTTLAHMIAKHSGYKPVEINASDDRSVDAFKSALENATQMRSLLDEQRRPNCLILDEIDGAPLPAIEYLIKFISGAPMTKAKKGQKVKPHILRRPVICICNDVYTASLRPLRQVAFVVHFPPTQVSRLAQRLAEVTLMEGFQADLSTLTALGEKTCNDIRACLGVLHFFKKKGKLLKLADIQKVNVGMKDMSKGLFQVWQEVFQIQLPKHKRVECANSIIKVKSASGTDEPDDGSESHSLKGRARKILNTVYSAGDYDRLAQGVYENYLNMKMKDSMLHGVCQALDWFTMSDTFTQYINSHQNYTLMPYLAHSFVSWHFLFAGLSWPKLKFPSQGFEMFQKQTQLSSVVTAMDRGMCPRIKPFNSKNVLILDSLPMLPHIITPALRPVNIQLYTQREKRDLATVVGVMLDYNVQYVQERSQDGTYTYVLDPDINKVGIFDEKTSSVRNIIYATKQLIAREVDLEKINRLELKATPNSNPKQFNEKAKVRVDMKNTEDTATARLPNHLQRLEPKKMKSNIPLVTKDFFGRTVTTSLATASKKDAIINDIVKSPIWYHYKEGFNNAVRRDVKISDLL